MEKLKKSERLRTVLQAVFFAFHNGYIKGWTQGKIYTGAGKAFCVPGLNCYSCPGAVGACPIGSLQAVLGSGKLPLYVLGFIGAVGILFGRLVCGFMCPFGWIQDLLYKIPLFKKAKNLPGHKYLKYLRYAVLTLAVVVLTCIAGAPVFCKWICPAGTLLGGLPLIAANEGLREVIGFRFWWKAGVLLLVLIAAVKLYRPFCKYLCPLGAVYGLCNGVSAFRLKVDEDKCIACGACRSVCGMDIRVWEKPNSAECIRCCRCVAVCPEEAITPIRWSDGALKYIKRNEDTGEKNR